MSDTGKSKKKGKGKLPEHLEVQRTHVICGPEMNYHPSTVTSANVYMPLGIDNSWNHQEFMQQFKIEIKDIKEDFMEFDMIGVDPAIANALRRILIAEVPTVAIEHVFIINNTSIIQDEVLAHRLGLVPLAVDPSKVDFKSKEEAPSEKNTLVFKLNVHCRRQGDVVVQDKVFSSDLTWLPHGSEMPDETSCRFASSGQSSMFSPAPAPVHKDILLAKLAPGQSIELEAHCTKGIAKDHAKWSPVATAWYQLQPEVVLLEDVTGDMADELMKLAPGMFKLAGSGAGRKAVVADVRGNMQHLEKVRMLQEQERWAELLQVRKRKDHFIFRIESVGILAPEVLLRQALDILSDKCKQLLTRL